MAIFIDELKNMTLYRKPFFAPINEENKKRKSVAFLLTPNIESSKRLMNNSFMINNGLFESYYVEKDITYFINQENALVRKFDQVFNEGLVVQEERSVEEYKQLSYNNDNIDKYIDDNFIDLTDSDGFLFVDYDKKDPKYSAHISVQDNKIVSFDNWCCSIEMNKDLIRLALKKFDIDGAVLSQTNASKSKCKALKDLGFEIDASNPKCIVAKPKKDAVEESTMTTKERNKLPDSAFGLPEERKYPLVDADHVKSAIKLFGHCPEDKKKSLARKIKSKADKLGIEIKDNSEVSKYLNESVELIDEFSVSSTINKDYKPNGKKNLNQFKEVPITKQNIDKYKSEYKSLKHVDTDNNNGLMYFDKDQLVAYVNVNDENYIQALEITKDYQGYGLSRQIMSKAINKLNADKLSVNKNNEVAVNLYKKLGFKVYDDTDKMYMMKLHESSINEELIDDGYRLSYITEGQYTLDDISLRIHTNESNCMIFFNEILDEQVFLESGSRTNQMLKRILYAERIRNNKEAFLLYEKIKQDVPWIRRTYIDYKHYKSFNLFVDWSFYTETFFKNNIYKLDKGIDLYFDFVTRFLNDSRLDLWYNKKTVFVPVLDWISTDDTDTWDYTKNLNPISMIYRIMKSRPEKIKEYWKDYNFVFLGSNGYFKVDFNTFDPAKDLPIFLNYIKLFIKKAPIVGEDDNTDSPKAIVATLVDKIEKSKGITINNLTGGTSKIPSEELEKKMNDGITSKDDPEVKKAELVTVLKQAAQKSLTTDDTINTIDKDIDKTYVKNLIMDLEDEEQNNIKTSNARASRMVELNNRFLDKKLDNTTVRDLIEKQKVNRELESTSLPIESINEDWKDLKFVNFEKAYNIREDVMSIMFSLSDKSVPISITDFKVEDNSTSEDFIETYTFNCEDSMGQRFSLKIDVPKIINNRFMRLRGNDKAINGQLALLPIIKTDEDTVQIVSNYNKIFVRRFGTNIGKSLPTTDKLIKTLSKYTGNDIVITYGDNTRVCSKYVLPIDYIDLSSVYSKIEVKGYYTFYFNQDELREKYKIDDTKGVPYGVNKYGEVMYCEGIFTVSQFILSRLLSYSDDKKGVTVNEEFTNIYNGLSSSNSTRYTYSKASILNTEIPLIVIMGYNEGLQSALKKANITYRLSEKRERVADSSVGIIKFNDAYLYYNIDYNSSLLMNGLKECNTEDYSIKDINNKAMWIDFLDIFGGRIKADGLDNFYDLMIDPITKEICEDYNLPTDYIEVLAYANMLLADNKYNKHIDITGNRLRTNEIISAYVYKSIANAYGEYKNQLKRNKKGTTMTIKQSIVIDSLLLDPTTSDFSFLNPLLEKESANTVSFKGISGMNSDRSYSLDKRTFDDSMVNVLALSTGFAANVGINRQATIDSCVQGKRGYIKQTNKNDMSITKTLSITEALTPFGTTRDDPFRSAMTFIQTAKHSMRIKKSTPMLVTNGADEALPYMTSDIFAHKAKGNGKVVEKTDNFMIVEYKQYNKNGVSITAQNGNREFIDLRENIRKNSDGGFFVTVKLDSDLKVGSTFKQNDILAYDKLSYSEAVGSKSQKDTRLSYSTYILAKVAIMQTDEGYEDSAIISDWLSDAMSSDIVVKKEYVLPKSTNVYNIVKKGQEIQEGETLMVFQNAFDDADANLLLKNITDDEELISELGRVPVRSKITGTVQDIKIYRTVEKDELSDSLKKLVNSYEKNISTMKRIVKKYNPEGFIDIEPDYKLDPTGKLKNANESVLIEFYLKYNDKMSVGDKLVYYSALKGVVKDIFPKGKEPYTNFRKNEKVHSLLALSSVNARMVSSVKVVGSINKAVIELDRAVKEIMGVEWKTIDEMNL